MDGSADVDEVVRRLSEIFGPKHDRNREQVAALVARFARIEQRLDEIERQTGWNMNLAKAAAAQAAAEAAAEADAPVPAPGERRPAAIDRACATDPADGPMRVLIPEFGRWGLEIEPEPGSDPEAIWPAVVTAIESVGRGSAVRRSRRARRD